MPAMELLCHLIDVNPRHFSKEENLILEAELFTHLCNALKELFKKQFKNYFRLMKFNLHMEDVMLEENFIRCVINDILASDAYTLSGIALYTQMPEEIIYEVATGRNINPSLALSRKIIELHRSVRPNLYREILAKLATLKSAEEMN